MKSLFYSVLSNATETSLNEAVPLGNIVRRYGRNIELSGNSIVLKNKGYYEIDVNSTFVAAQGNVAFELLSNGIPVDGATAIETVETANTQYCNASIHCIVRVYCCYPVNIQIVTNGTAAPTISNLAVTVKEI